MKIANARRRRSISDRLIDLLRDEIRAIENEGRDRNPKDENCGGPSGAGPRSKDRIERIAQATRTFEKLMELKRAETAEASRATDDVAEAERLRDELLAQVRLIDEKRIALLQDALSSRHENGSLGDAAA